MRIRLKDLLAKYFLITKGKRDCRVKPDRHHLR